MSESVARKVTPDIPLVGVTTLDAVIDGLAFARLSRDLWRDVNRRVRAVSSLEVLRGSRYPHLTSPGA